MTTKHRAKLARENAGLSVGQACKMLGLTREELTAIEESDQAFADVPDDVGVMALVYGVNREWLAGEIPRHDYAAVDKIDGADRLTFHDRDVLAETLAAMPRATP